LIELMIAAALAQSTAQPADPCNAVATPAPAPPACPAWRPVNSHGDGSMSVDPASLRRSGDAFEIATRIVFSSDRPDGGRSGINLLRFDCRAMSLSLVHITVYTAAGIRMSETAVTGDDARPQLLIDGSPLAGLISEYCPAVDATERRARLAALQAAAGEWRSASRDDEAELFFDTVPAERSGDSVTVRTLMRFHAVRPDGVRSHITTLRFNCPARTASMRHMTVFRDDGAPMIDEDLTGDTAAEQPVGHTAGRMMIDAFCPR